MITFMYLCLSLLLLLVAIVADLTPMANNQYRPNMITTLIASVGSVIFAALVLRRSRRGLFRRGLAALIVIIAVLLIFDAIGRF